MTFKDIFIDEASDKLIEVPDYQRAYSWEKKQIDLFIGDMEKHHDRGAYYFGHFILEQGCSSWELVDGQQRLTTLVLFLLVCQSKLPSTENMPLFCLLKRFRTVNYDQPALDSLMAQTDSWPKLYGKKQPSDEEIVSSLHLKASEFTLSQRRMVHAALRFHEAFEKETLRLDRISAYINVVSESLCSRHLTYDKAVAVNVFEMHNTRGVALKLIEVIKAKLMRFVYQHGGEDKNSLVSQIQSEFATIHAMEERLAVSSFKGEMTMESILRHHLRVIDDGQKKDPQDYNTLEKNAGSDKLIEFIDSRLSNQVDNFLSYPLNLARELKKSVRILCDILPTWDEKDRMVGDVMILRKGISCEFFLLICRRFESAPGEADGTISTGILLLWERLLFTHDFHGEHHNLKGMRDNFPAIYANLSSDEADVAALIKKHLAVGFRPDCTPNLQKTVKEHLIANREHVLRDAYNWWMGKMAYALYKYEIHRGAKLRGVMKEKESIEHILPQGWDWSWAEDGDNPPRELAGKELSEYRKKTGEHVSSFIHGIGNLLLITREENSSVSNDHPAKKRYTDYCSGGSYAIHDENREHWLSSANWENLIRSRGEAIFDFIINNLLADDKTSTAP
jgi:hypothetical protein